MMEQGGTRSTPPRLCASAWNLLEPQSNGIGGEVPTLVYSATEKKAFAISGMGWSPASFTVEWCRTTAST